MPWLQGALSELRATAAAQNLPTTGPAGGIYTDDLFTHHRGQATIFLPCGSTPRPMGRVTAVVIPKAELAIIEHKGPPTEADRTYGTLATYVTRHALAVEGPIREYYLTNQQDTPNQSEWRTEIGWPVFHLTTTPT